MAIRITWDTSNTVDLKIGPAGLSRPFKRIGFQQRSASGKVQTVGLENFAEPIVFDAYFQEAVYRQLIPWMAWAEQGNTFSFAEDSDVVDPYTVGAVCLIRSTDKTKYEIIVVESISGGNITAVDNLVYGYDAGSIICPVNYFPSVRIPKDWIFNPNKQGDWYHQAFSFVEDLSNAYTGNYVLVGAAAAGQKVISVSWMAYFDNTRWTPSIYGTWTGSGWLSGWNGAIWVVSLVVSGTWADGYRPGFARVTVDTGSNLFSLSDTGTDPILYNDSYESLGIEAITFESGGSADDLKYFSISSDSQLTVTNIEFSG